MYIFPSTKQDAQATMTFIDNMLTAYLNTKQNFANYNFIDRTKTTESFYGLSKYLKWLKDEYRELYYVDYPTKN